MTDLTKPIITVPAENSENFGTAASEALLQIPAINDFAEQGNNLQETVYNTPTVTSIIGSPSGFTADNTYKPLRLNRAGTALTTERQDVYDDGGEIVQFKGLQANSNLYGYRRQEALGNDEYTITASESSTGDVRINAIFSGNFEIRVGTKRVLNIHAISRIHQSGVRFTSVDSAQVETALGLPFLPIYALRFSLVRSETEGTVMTLNMAGFGQDGIISAMDEGNGYLATVPGHRNHLPELSFQFITANRLITPANASIQISGIGSTDPLTPTGDDLDPNVNIFNGYLYDAQIQTGSAYNYFTS